MEGVGICHQAANTASFRGIRVGGIRYAQPLEKLVGIRVGMLSAELSQRTAGLQLLVSATVAAGHHSMSLGVESLM